MTQLDPALIDQEKQAAGKAAAALVRSAMKVGLGTGSTVHFTITAIGEAWQQGSLRDLQIVPTSERTAALARSFGLPLVDLSDCGALDITIDGADEVDPRMNLIKGLGGALLREKIVACASHIMVVAVDAHKLVSRLGTIAPVPVEVEPFGWRLTQEQLTKLGCRTTLRQDAEGKPFKSDGGHFIVDCHFAGIDDPASLERAIKQIPGALECGLFVGIARRVVAATEEGVRSLGRDGQLEPFQI